METRSQKSPQSEPSHTLVRLLPAWLLPAWLLIVPIRLYRYLLSPWLGQHCRFEPTCSVYAEQALRRFGLLHGSYLAARRLLKCHPWHHGGIDPLPESKQ